MKFLKKYKVFEGHSNDILKQDIIDILTPLTDDGIGIDVQPKEKRGVPTGIEIYISKKGGMHSDREGFRLTPYIDELIHLNSFLEDNGWVLTSDPRVSDRNWSFNDSIDNIKKTDTSYATVPMFYVPKDNKVLNVTSELSRDTIIDFEKKEIHFPFMEGYKPYPFAHLTPHHYIFFVKPIKPNSGGPVPPFIRYCKSKYGVTDDEMESVWAKYKHRMWERMIEPR